MKKKFLIKVWVPIEGDQFHMKETTDYRLFFAKGYTDLNKQVNLLFPKSRVKTAATYSKYFRYNAGMLCLNIFRKKNYEIRPVDTVIESQPIPYTNRYGKAGVLRFVKDGSIWTQLFPVELDYIIK